jgi:hypothetical protein
VVAFLTFLLGLTVGVQRIELAVDHRVASVELLLDGQRVALIQGEPWVAECDFGRALLPHHLEAVARDADGNELDRALQRVNLPRAAAEATMRLEEGADGYTGAVLSWRAADESDPEEIQVRFDGEPLAVDKGRVSLPRHDRKSVHVLTAELIFHDQLRAEVEVAFGGDYGEEVSTELTAVALELDSWKSLPSAAEVESWLRIGGQPARVVAVESGPREVVLVRDDASKVTLRSLGRQTSGTGPRRTQSASRMSAGLDVKDTLRLTGTHPVLAPIKGGGFTMLFPMSANVNSHTSGLGFSLTNLFFRVEAQEREELVAEAVAVAGLRAVASNRERALILVRSTEAPPPPAGSLDPANVRGFLSALGVPFFYWTVGPTRDGAADAWGQAKAVRGWGGVHLAVGELIEALRPQFLVWVEGLHKPTDVTLTPGAPAGLRRAGAAPAAISDADTRPSRRASPAEAG